MNVVTILDDLKSRGFIFRIDGENIRCRPTKEPLTAEILKTLKEHKPEIIDVLYQKKQIHALDQLPETEREAYQGWYDVMVGPNHKMSPEQAHQKAWALLQKSSAVLAEDQIKRIGFVKIYSAHLGRYVYLCQDESTTKRVPDYDREPVCWTPLAYRALVRESDHGFSGILAFT